MPQKMGMLEEVPLEPLVPIRGKTDGSGMVGRWGLGSKLGQGECKIQVRDQRHQVWMGMARCHFQEPRQGQTNKWMAGKITESSDLQEHFSRHQDMTSFLSNISTSWRTPEPKTCSPYKKYSWHLGFERKRRSRGHNSWLCT